MDVNNPLIINRKVSSNTGKPFVLSRALYAVVDFIYPPTCLICSQNLEQKKFLCPLCFSELIQSIDVSVETESSGFSQIKQELHFDSIVTCFDFSPNIETLIHELKYKRGIKLGYFLGQILAKSIFEKIDCQVDMIVPVPLHRIKQRERGYNQSDILCKGISTMVSLPVCSGLLTRKINTKTQTLLSAEDRQINVHDAFVVKKSKDIIGKSILIVDDVVTTGATMNSCARALKNTGAKKVVGAALARPVSGMLT